MFRAEIWQISEILSENFQFFVVKFSMYLNRRVFVMFYVAIYVVYACINLLNKSFLFYTSVVFNLYSLTCSAHWWEPTFEAAHNKTFSRTCATIEVSDPSAHPRSLLIAVSFYSLQAIQRGINKNPCYTWWTYSLMWTFAGHTGLIVDFVVLWLICLKTISAV